MRPSRRCWTRPRIAERDLLSNPAGMITKVSTSLTNRRVTRGGGGVFDQVTEKTAVGSMEGSRDLPNPPFRSSGVSGGCSSSSGSSPSVTVGTVGLLIAVVRLCVVSGVFCGVGATAPGPDEVGTWVGFEAISDN